MPYEIICSQVLKPFFMAVKSERKSSDRTLSTSGAISPLGTVINGLARTQATVSAVEPGWNFQRADKNINAVPKSVAWPNITHPHKHTDPYIHTKDNKKTKEDKKRNKSEAIRRDIFCCAHVLSVKYDMTNTAQSKDNAERGRRTVLLRLLCPTSHYSSGARWQVEGVVVGGKQSERQLQPREAIWPFHCLPTIVKL